MTWIEDELPDGVGYVTWHLFSPSSAITVLVAGFALEGETMRSPIAVLNASHSTYVKPYSDSGFSIVTPEHQKRDEIGEWRSLLLEKLSIWLQARMPGAFARMSICHLPSIELLLTAKAVPWSEEAKVEGSGRLGTDPYYLLGLGGKSHWQCDEEASLRLVEPGFDDKRGELKRQLRLGARREEFISAIGRSEQKEGGDERTQLWDSLHRIDSMLAPFLSQWAMNGLLAEIQRDLAELRDLAEESTRNSSPRSLTKLKNKLLRAGLDGQMVAAEIARVARNESKEGASRFQDGPEFSYSFGRAKLVKNLRLRRIAVGEAVVSTESRLRELLATTAELTVAATNLRLQNRVLWLTVMSVVVALAAAVISFVALDATRSQPPPVPATTAPSAAPAAPATPSPAATPLSSP